ncbi:hypothetical protein M9H77_12862 [Catharanthus roseus]|uniref:Uncharacterized protein n=1 Tax=Catharanthus roseus TaxID=4058 RepID=A0ACC0BIQ8_CATRO|nr:hypothetical protein M9H77_12862 [Catharanthus roseus]
MSNLKSSGRCSLSFTLYSGALYLSRLIHYFQQYTNSPDTFDSSQSQMKYKEVLWKTLSWHNTTITRSCIRWEVPIKIDEYLVLALHHLLHTLNSVLGILLVDVELSLDLLLSNLEILQPRLCLMVDSLITSEVEEVSRNSPEKLTPKCVVVVAGVWWAVVDCEEDEQRGRGMAVVNIGEKIKRGGREKETEKGRKRINGRRMVAWWLLLSGGVPVEKDGG